MWEDKLSAGIEAVHVNEGALVFRAEQHPKIARVQAGLLRVFIATQLGRQLTIYYARPGDLFGLAPYLPVTDEWNAEAITDASVIVLSNEQFRTATAEDPDLARTFMEHVTTWTAEALRGVADDAGQSVMVRVARHLRQLSLRGPDGQLTVHMSHQRVADAVGTVREVINRELNALRSSGIVQTAAGSITIVDERRLEDIAAGPVTWRPA